MLKYLSYLAALLLLASTVACGTSESSSTTAEAIYVLPSTFASYTTARPHLLGGTVQGTPLALNKSVSTFAGTTGTSGFINYTASSDPSATFNHPTDITTDGTNFFVSDYGNNLIRKITPTGSVSTLPLSFNRPSGITTDGKNLYVVNSASNTILFIEIATNIVTTIGSTSGLSGSVDSKTVPADVRFNQPIGITTDGINLYVTDSGNHTVRMINIATKAVSTLAGTSGTIGSTDGIQKEALFNQPARITTDGANLYLADFANRTIRKIEISTGKVTTIAGKLEPVGTNNGTTDGIGSEARFYQPNGITTDGYFLYVTDSFHNTIRKIDIAPPYNVTTISGVAGSFGYGGSVDSSSGIATFYNPVGITTDGKSLYVADSFNNTIRKIE